MAKEGSAQPVTHENERAAHLLDTGSERTRSQVVRIQECQTSPNRLLIGSDLSDASMARKELEKWAESHGYYLPRDSRNLSVY